MTLPSARLINGDLIEVGDRVKVDRGVVTWLVEGFVETKLQNPCIAKLRMLNPPPSMGSVRRKIDLYRLSIVEKEIAK